MKVRYEIIRNEKAGRKGEVTVEVKDGRRVEFREPIRVREDERVVLYFPKDICGKLDVNSVQSVYPDSEIKAEIGAE